MTRPLRSILFVPGTREDRFASAIGSGADGVVFDLEDGVEASRKAEARQAVGRLFRESADASPLRLVRINPASTLWFHDDLEFVTATAGIGGIVLPKCETVEQVRIVAEVVGAERVFPLIETARGVLNALSVAEAVPPLPALLFGAEDLTAEMGVPRTIDGEELLFARSQVSLAAVSSGADAIDAVFTNVADADGLRRDALRARALGFRGKMSIHPSQIAVINEVFSPSSVEIAQAARVVAAFANAQSAGDAVLRLGDEMIDAPVVARAQRVLDLAERLGLTGR
jgi:citrate lyase subunit beta / citryl-CoA lyase